MEKSRARKRRIEARSIKKEDGPQRRREYIRRRNERERKSAKRLRDCFRSFSRSALGGRAIDKRDRVQRSRRRGRLASFSFEFI